MANDEHLMELCQGSRILSGWVRWRKQNPNVQPDLSDADLGGVDFSGADLSYTDLTAANLGGANLSSANLEWANLLGANLEGTNLAQSSLINANLEAANFKRANFFKASLLAAVAIDADLSYANLSGANLSGANFDGANFAFAKLRHAILEGTNLTNANLDEADFALSNLYEVILSRVDLSTVGGLSHCRFRGPSCVDHRTILKSKNVPLKFWRGCGLPDVLIDYMQSLTGEAIQFYSCFISYSSKDQEFADRLHADMQDAGVRCWFAPHDLPIGAKTWDGIDQAIQTRDKVLLILSEDAIASDWVEDEVTKAFAEERRRKDLVLFPVRLDEAAMETNEPWAGKLRDNRNIGNFTRWKDHDAYQLTLKQLLRDLKVER